MQYSKRDLTNTKQSSDKLSSAGFTLAAAVQALLWFHCCKDAQLSQSVIPWPVLILGVIPSQIWDPINIFVKYYTIPVGPVFQSVEISVCCSVYYTLVVSDSIFSLRVWSRTL